MTDEDAVRALISAHFEPMRWGDGTEPDRARFRGDFHPDAVLCGAARPAQLRSVSEFIERRGKWPG